MNTDTGNCHSSDTGEASNRQTNRYRRLLAEHGIHVAQGASFRHLLQASDRALRRSAYIATDNETTH